MLENSFGLFAFLKKSKSQKESRRYVYLRITVDGKSKEISTKRLWSPGKWSHEAGRAIGAKEDAKSLNAYLDALNAQIYQAKLKLIESGNVVTAENLKNLIVGKGDDRRTILEEFSEHNKQMAALVGKEFVAGTLCRYRTTYNYVKSFIRWKYGKDDLALHELNFDFVSDFAFWLKSVKNCEHNTTVKYIMNLKKIVLRCMRRGWLQRDPFLHFKTTKKEVIRVALTQEELDSIRTKSISVERLSLVRDIFLFSCYTGLAYVDVSNLKRSHIIKGIDGEQWIITRRKKTGSPTRLPLLPVALQIINKYRDHVKCIETDQVLPILTNQKMNSYLKEIADICRISKNLTFHIARHTFATTVTLTNGVPLETVSKMLGHSSLKQTQHYAKILDTKISQDMQVLRKKLKLYSLSPNCSANQCDNS